MHRGKVVLVGHSYVRRLKKYRHQHTGSQWEINEEGISVDLGYVFQGGQDYEFFNDSWHHKARILQENPDVVLVVLGGNAVANSVPTPQAAYQMHMFVNWLKRALPLSVIVIAEVEPRYNWHEGLPADHDPEVESFKTERNNFNQAVRRLRAKDFTLRVANCLCSRGYYNYDGVHFNDKGNKFYWEIIINTLKHVMERRFPTGAVPDRF